MCLSITSLWFKNRPTKNIMNHAKQSHLQMHEKCTLYILPARLKVNWPRINYSVFKAHHTSCVLSPWLPPPPLLPRSLDFSGSQSSFPPPQKEYDIQLSIHISQIFYLFFKSFFISLKSLHNLRRKGKKEAY